MYALCLMRKLTSFLNILDDKIGKTFKFSCHSMTSAMGFEKKNKLDWASFKTLAKQIII